MRMASIRSAVLAITGAVILGFLPTVLAHGDEDMGGMGGADSMNMTADPKPAEDSYLPTYFAHLEHQGVMWAHVLLMVLGWVFVLPVAVMLSLARSRYTLALQFVFLAVNAFGVLLGIIYNASTPDLYPNNAHHKIGWIITWVVCAQVVIGLLGRVAGVLGAAPGNPGKDRQRTLDERGAFLPVSTRAMEEHASRFPNNPYRLSNDSGQGTEPNTESLRSHSVSTNGDEPVDDARHKEFGNHHDGAGGGGDDDDVDDVDLDAQMPSVARRGGRIHELVQKLSGICSSRTWKFLRLGYNVIDRIILIFGFIALTTGIITQARFFEGHNVFSGLAHWIKGGIFFWLGIFTLGRWCGSFGDFGWAWNVRPRQAHKRWCPSSEFAESFLIFFYGATNVFLEHLGNSGKAYSSQDLEHVSITVLFIGGGLCGMLIESVSIRDLLNTTVMEAARAGPAEEAYGQDEEERAALRPPRQYNFSMNPIPALVILLLGIMMSSHTQQSMISSMVHKQWGNLLAGASFARAFTYVLIYLKPPKSILPSRPPTELLCSFGLISGGIIFMASSSSTVDGMIHYDLDAMFMYTVTMGFVGLLMAWVIIVIAIKGWAVRREAGRPNKGAYRMA